MKLQAYAVYDAKAMMFNRPVFAVQDGEAVRTFCDAVAHPDHHFNKHPEDYSLFRIGTYKDDNAEIVDEPNVQLITGLEAVRINTGEADA
jgi:hypothetical protein